MTNQNGFSLLEQILYVAMLAMVTFMVSVLLAALLRAEARLRLVRDIDDQGMIIFLHMTRAVRGAAEITTPATAASDDVLRVTMSDPDGRVLEFSVIDGVLGLTQDAGPWFPLSNSKVRVTDFSVQEVSQSGSPQSVRLELSLSSAGESVVGGYAYTRQLVTTVNIH